MDPLDIAEFDTLTKCEVKSDPTVDDDFDFVFVDKPALPASSPPKLSSSKGSDLLFSFDEGPALPEGENASAPISFDGQDLFGGDLQTTGSRDPFTVDMQNNDEPQSSLFDDFWDMASVSVVPPRPADQLPEENPVPDVTTVPNVDLLFGVEVDQQASSVDVRVTNQPDILDFFESISAPNPVNTTKMEGDDIFAESFNEIVDINCERDISSHLEKDITLEVHVIKDSENLSSVVHAVKESVDIFIDEADGRNIEEKTDDGDKEQMETSARQDEGQDKVDGISSNGHDFDFSLLELPGTAHLNLDLSKHKRSLSQKGSIARRKRPTRAAILASDNEDSIYVDSTEPKLVKTDVLDGCTSSKVEKPDTSFSAEEDKSPIDPSKRYGGVKIPGLLEGLSKTKVFAKNEPTETPKRPETKIPTPALRSQAPAEIGQAPQIKSKPLVLPRVLPSVQLKPASKTQKETQNHSTACEASPAKPLQGTDNKLSTASNEHKDSKVPVTHRVLPSKPELKPVTGHEAAKTAAKVPPPVPSKPSMPVKPLRSGLLGSASFSTADRPGMIRKSALPPLSNHNGNVPGLDSTDSSATTDKTDLTSVLKTQVTTPSNILKKELTNTSASSSSQPESSKTTTVTRASSLRAPGTVGYTDRFKFKPRDSEITVSSHVETVTAVSTGSTKNGNSIGVSENCELSDHQKENPVLVRKSSISGISSVKSPSITDKSQANTGARRGSFTGSAYNPIGFRPSVSSTDGEEARSRSSSTSDEVPISKQGTVPVIKPSNEVAIETEVHNSLKTVDSSHLTNYSAKIVEEHKILTTVEEKKKEAVIEEKKKEAVIEEKKKEAEIEEKKKEAVILEKKKEAVIEEKKKEAVIEEKKKETVNETNKVIRDQVKLTPVKPAVQHSIPDKIESAQDKASPWNVRLRKVEKKEKTPEPQPTTQESTDSPSNWRQQLAQKRRSVATTREPEKTKDSTPEWARASIHRRQRLIDSGIISADGK